MAIQVRDQQGNKVNKYIKESILQGYYGCGWEDLCAYYKGGLKEYDTNERGIAHRVIHRQSINPLWLSLISGKPISTYKRMTREDLNILINKQ